MKVNFGFFISKFLRWINRPALRDCDIDSSSKIGTGSNLISVKMGRYSYVGKNNSITNANIGSFCSIASYCAIGGGSHNITLISTSPIFTERRNIFGKKWGTTVVEHKPVNIGNDVWIGEKVFINEGLTIGNGAVIGAHSVVTHDIPPYAIAVGAPAKVIKYRFSSDDIEFIEQSDWWGWSETDLKRVASTGAFDSVDMFKNFSRNERQ